MDSCKLSWSNLPEELLERILSFLPVCSILQSRCVCRRWKEISSSNNFFHHWAAISAPAPWFLMFRSGCELAAYNPSLDSWHRIPISLELPLSAVVASAGGLICLRSSSDHVSGAAHLIVSNPLTTSCKVLPELTRIRSPLIMGMLADQHSNSYKILVSGSATKSSCKDILTEIYDSATASWDYHGWSDLEILQECSGMRALWSNGCFYCLSVPMHQLLSYNMQQKQWTNLINLKTPVPNLYSASLLVCNGGLVLAGKVDLTSDTSESVRLKNICVWELKRESSNWVEVKPTPGSISCKFFDSLAFFMMLEHHRGADAVCFNSWCRWRTLMYDTSQRSWRWLPDHCGSFRQKLNGLIYMPSFLTKA